MNKDAIKYALLLAIALGAPPAYSSYWQWSKTAATNAGADPSINWAEGQSPSSVNDSARAMMARSAEYRDDISGLLATSGTATAYTVVTNQGLPDPPTDGQLISISFHANNGADATLAADGGTGYPIRTSSVTSIPADTLVQTSPYTLKFHAGLGAWLLRDFYGTPFTIPIGGMVVFTGTTSPNSNFVFPIGQCISRTTYAAYFALVSTTYGGCDGSTTFGVPDLRERTLAFQGTMGGASSPSRITSGGSGIDGTALGASGGAQNETIAQGNLPAVTLTTSISSGQGSHNHSISGNGNAAILTMGAGGLREWGVPPNTPGTGDSTASAMSSNTLPAMSGTTPLGGSGNALPTMPPTIMLSMLLRIR